MLRSTTCRITLGILLLVSGSCESSGRSLGGYELEKRTDAVGRIVNAALIVDTIRIQNAGGSPNASTLIMDAFAGRFAGMPNSADVSADEESYLRSDVDACIRSIWAVGLANPAVVGAVTCNLEPRPAVLFGNIVF